MGAERASAVPCECVGKLITVAHRGFSHQCEYVMVPIR
jgi:hypothetical protein